MRYAKALLAYAKAQKVEDRVYEEVKTLAGHYVSLPDLRRAIENPVLDMQSKCDLLREASGGKDVSQELMRFFNLVLDERREKFLQFMLWSYIDLYREDKKYPCWQTYYSYRIQTLGRAFGGFGRKPYSGKGRNGNTYRS